MLTDYHIHTCYSADSSAPVKDQLDAAVSAGLTHICFADHVDFDESHLPPADIIARNEEVLRLAPLYPSLDISLGAEIGMDGENANRDALEYLGSAHVDFIIGSVHVISGEDVYYPKYFEGRKLEEAFGLYIDKLVGCIKVSKFNIMGHYDFCTKYSPYADRSMRYSLFPEQFDDIFHTLIHSGRSLEINTSAWKDDPAWGLDVFRRYRELGGEFVTVGSDAHKSEKVGCRVKEAAALAEAAGIKYIATYKNMQPQMHRI